MLNLIERLELLARSGAVDESAPDEPTLAEGRVLSVSELNAYVQRALAADPMLQGLRLRGEVSNLKRHTSGHLYFSLKDEAARIQCVMFRPQAQMCAVRPEDGLRVVAEGRAALFPRDGAYQFYVESMRMDGVGALFLRYEETRRRLLAEGLFDAARKKPLPLLPRGVGIVTSPTGAVIRDIETVAARRHPGVPLYLAPVRVQGAGAADDIARGIRALDRLPFIDVIITGRGGGSLEDLWAFNEEQVVRAVADCVKPIVSAVGHETDTTLTDFAADIRAPTPSAAAELAVPLRSALLDQVGQYRARMLGAADRQAKRSRERLANLAARLNAAEPRRALGERRKRIADLRERLRGCAGRVIPPKRETLAGLAARLTTLNPSSALERGYAMVADEQGRWLNGADRVKPGMALSIRMRGGEVRTDAAEVILNEGGGTRAG
ncbi:MAG: exodeoxyribonuclease VII large subunit [Oscillospiraceae bacterium]|nr:exodeoxyribonuclease VII large subunit [Oscillospiraceae bacterium]